MKTINGVDHTIIAVDDLSEGEIALTRLGFHLTPRGIHSAHKGTANATAVFKNGTYIEILGVTAPTEWNTSLRDALAAHRYLYGVAMKTTDAAAAFDEFAEAGIGAEAMNAFSRPVELADGTHEASFRTTNIAHKATPGAHAFVCEHLTPDVVWRPDFLDQSNAVVGLKSIIGVAEDLDMIAARWGHLSPTAPKVEPSRVTMDFGNAAVEFMTPAAYGDAYGPPPSTEPSLAALVFLSGDLGKTRAVLEDADIPEPASLTVPPECGAGITMRFVPA
ncbi:VOC family protein [Acuticoccus sp. M5D2P5]|uniref:VOC family protein n=1 Tax=Acuticoccus kalidii TaxID=2910977 RepID=UPI001F3E1F16|nr:VOC family protein [Acuticoccus kalidii]MCF3932567.1 VOC family protein [Acuticoccus kalidii]